MKLFAVSRLSRPHDVSRIIGTKYFQSSVFYLRFPISIKLCGIGYGYLDNGHESFRYEASSHRCPYRAIYYKNQFFCFFSHLVTLRQLLK